MDCPHCGAESLLGAKICSACGKNMMVAPRFQPHATVPAAKPADATATQAPFSQLPTEPNIPPQLAAAAAALPPAPSAPPAAPAPSGPPVAAICRVCQEGFDRPEGETGTPICTACRQFATADGGDAGPNEVTLHPATQPQPGVDPKAGSAIRRRPVVRRASLRAGPVAAVVGLVLVAAGFAVVKWIARDVDPAAEYLGDTHPEEATFVVAPNTTGVTRLETTLDLNIRREMVRAAFSSRLDEVLNLQQRTVQTADVAWAKDDAGTTLVDAFAECRVAMQTGTAASGDARELKAYPWEGFKATARAVVSRGAATVLASGEPAIAGRDFTPCLTLGDVAAPAGTVAAGQTWRTQLVLPVLATRDGALRPAPVRCEITYNGRKLQRGAACWLLSVRGDVPRAAADGYDEMNRASGSVRGALFYEAKTGLLLEAHVKTDASVWAEKGRVDDKIHVTGTMDVRRP
jgi:hypothetical protein